MLRALEKFLPLSTIMRNTYATTVIISLDFILLNNQIHPRWHNMRFDSMENSSPVLSLLHGFIIICPVKSNSFFSYLRNWTLSNFKYTFAGWKDSILSLPKRWLSQQSTDTDEYGFPLVSYTAKIIKTHFTNTSYIVVIYHRIKLCVSPHLRWSEIKSILHVVELSNMKLSPPLINEGELDFYMLRKKGRQHTRESLSWIKPWAKWMKEEEKVENWITQHSKWIWKPESETLELLDVRWLHTHENDTL